MSAYGLKDANRARTTARCIQGVTHPCGRCTQCVYEWAAFLVHHKPNDINICVDAFMLPGTVPIYVESIEKLSVESCKCYNEDDRETLRSKVRAQGGLMSRECHASGLMAASSRAGARLL